MSKKSKPIAIAGTLSTIRPHARLPLAIAGLLLSAQSQALLPTPLSLVTTGELATTASSPAIANRTIKRAIDDGRNNNEVNNDHSMQNIKNTNAEQQLNTWRQQVQSSNLAEHITWRRLLYIVDDKKGLFAKKNSKSAVTDAQFFLTPNGQENAAAEMDALLVAMAAQTNTAHSSTSTNSVSNVSSNAPSNALCRFPARAQWLADTLNIDKSALQADCPELDVFMTMLAPEQLSVMFAKEYLDNPRSAYVIAH